MKHRPNNFTSWNRICIQRAGYRIWLSLKTIGLAFSFHITHSIVLYILVAIFHSSDWKSEYIWLVMGQIRVSNTRHCELTLSRNKTSKSNKICWFMVLLEHLCRNWGKKIAQNFFFHFRENLCFTILNFLEIDFTR